MFSPSKIEELNQDWIGLLISNAIRSDCPDFSTVADLMMEKFSRRAASSTRARVLLDTNEGLLKARETVETDTCAEAATS